MQDETLREIRDENAEIVAGLVVELADPDLTPQTRRRKEAQLKAAEALAPYLHRKKPIDVVIEDERLPTLIINMGSNQLATAEQIAAGQGLRIDVQPEPASINEIKGLSVGRIAEASNGRKGKAKE